MSETKSAGFGGADATTLLAEVRARRDEYVSLVRTLAELETPTDDARSQEAVQQVLRDALEDLGFRVEHVPGQTTGGHLLAMPADLDRDLPVQLLVGHCDTVWPVGTLGSMPVAEEGGRLAGPGTFDMKAGLAHMIFALRVLRDLGLRPPATPMIFINSDEEIGSPESGGTVRRLAGTACRAFVPEPSLGPEGRLKTARKGVGNFVVEITGQAAHAGLNPGGGASAITELAHVIQELHALTDLERGTTVNVGVVEGGTRTNVVAAHARAEVDVRVVTMEEGRKVEAAITSLRPVTPGVSISITGGMKIPPLERTPRNRRLWEAAKEAAAMLGMEVDEAMVGGASDGSVISQFTATLDGLGAVGDGAHAAHEHIVIDDTVDRCALFAMLLMAPLDTEGERP